MTIIFRIIFIIFSIFYLNTNQGKNNPNWLLILYWPLLGFVYYIKCISLGIDIKNASTTPSRIPNIEKLNIQQYFKEHKSNSKLAISCLFMFSAYYYRYAIANFNIILLIIGIPISLLFLVIYNNDFFKNDFLLENDPNLKAMNELSAKVKKIKIPSEAITIIIFTLLFNIVTKNINIFFINISNSTEFIQKFGLNKFTILFIVSFILFAIAAISFFKFSEFLMNALTICFTKRKKIQLPFRIKKSKRSDYHQKK